MASPEIWKRIPSLPGLMASNKGRIMVAPYFGPLPNGGSRRYGGTAVKGQWDGTRLIYVFKGKTYKVARLVCETFNGPAPVGKPNCLHDDENSRNNEPSNLKWGTQKENMNAPGFLAYCRSRTGENSPTFKSRKNAA